MASPIQEQMLETVKRSNVAEPQQPVVQQPIQQGQGTYLSPTTHHLAPRRVYKGDRAALEFVARMQGGRQDKRFGMALQDEYAQKRTARKGGGSSRRYGGKSKGSGSGNYSDQLQAKLAQRNKYMDEANKLAGTDPMRSMELRKIAERLGKDASRMALSKKGMRYGLGNTDTTYDTYKDKKAQGIAPQTEEPKKEPKGVGTRIWDAIGWN